MGPIMSKMFKKHSAFVKRVSMWGRPAPPRVRRTSVFDLHKSKTLAQSGIHFRCANQITGSPAALAAGAGPTIMGPIMSKMFKKHSAFVKRVSMWGRPAPPRVRRTSVFDLHKSKTLAQSGIHFRCANKITGSPAALAAGAGPTMMGPMMSKMFKKHSAFVKMKSE